MTTDTTCGPLLLQAQQQQQQQHDYTPTGLDLFINLFFSLCFDSRLNSRAHKSTLLRLTFEHLALTEAQTIELSRATTELLKLVSFEISTLLFFVRLSITTIIISISNRADFPLLHLHLHLHLNLHLHSQYCCFLCSHPFGH